MWAKTWKRGRLSRLHIWRKNIASRWNNQFPEPRVHVLSSGKSKEAHLARSPRLRSRIAGGKVKEAVLLPPLKSIYLDMQTNKKLSK